MKRIITLAAVAAVGAAFAAVESDNIVGYQTLDGNQGFTQITPSFAGVTNDYSVQDIVISGDNVMGYGGETLQFVDSEGNCPEFYTWFDKTVMGASGWYDADSALATRTISPGESFLVSNDAGTYKIQIAGQVNFTAVPALACSAGFSSVGNMTPVAKGIQKYAIAGDNVLGYGGETLQFVDAEGNCPEFYTWFDATMMGTSGWYDADSALAEREVKAGEGFLLSNDTGDYTVNVPATND